MRLPPPRALASSLLSSIGRFKRVDGGYPVSGFWRYSSGCDYCAANLDRMGVGRISAVEREAIRHDIAEATSEVDAARPSIRRTVSEIERAGKARVDAVASRTARLCAIAGPAGATEV